MTMALPKRVTEEVKDTNRLLPDSVWGNSIRPVLTSEVCEGGFESGLGRKSHRKRANGLKICGSAVGRRDGPGTRLR